MKKIIFIIISMVIISVLVLSGCDVLVRPDDSSITGSGVLETRDYDFNDFTRVEFNDAFEYEITQSETYSISITADDNLFEDIRVTKNGNKLEIDLKPFFRFNITKLEAAITMPRLTALESGGATHGMVSGFDAGDNLDLEISGASRVNLSDLSTGHIDASISGASTLKMDVVAGDVDMSISGVSRIEGGLIAQNMIVDMSGASWIELEGSAKDIAIDASGASRVLTEKFPVDNADISLSGASTCNIEVDGRIDINLSGASKLTYAGNPVLGSMSLSGGSTINGKTQD